MKRECNRNSTPHRLVERMYSAAVGAFFFGIEEYEGEVGNFFIVETEQNSTAQHKQRRSSCTRDACVCAWAVCGEAECVCVCFFCAPAEASAHPCCG